MGYGLAASSADLPKLFWAAQHWAAMASFPAASFVNLALASANPLITVDCRMR